MKRIIFSEEAKADIRAVPQHIAMNILTAIQRLAESGAGRVMNLDISSKTEALLAAKAREQGLSTDAFLERLLKDTGNLTVGAANGGVPELPVWHLGVRGSLHRRDVYDDVG